MNIDVTQYRGSIGQHYTASRTPMTRKKLSYLDVLCISLFCYTRFTGIADCYFLIFRSSSKRKQLPLCEQRYTQYIKGVKPIINFFKIFY